MGRRTSHKKAIAELTATVNASTWEDKQDILNILNRWAVGDFSSVVTDHNYVWNKLGGDTGIATGIREHGAPSWSKK